jgi:hypothetical protein
VSRRRFVLDTVQLGDASLCRHHGDLPVLLMVNYGAPM